MEAVDHLTSRKFNYYMQRGVSQIAKNWVKRLFGCLYPLPQLGRNQVEQYGHITLEHYNEIRCGILKKLRKPGVIALLRAKSIYLAKYMDIPMGNTDEALLLKKLLFYFIHIPFNKNYHEFYFYPIQFLIIETLSEQASYFHYSFKFFPKNVLSQRQRVINF